MMKRILAILLVLAMSPMSLISAYPGNDGSPVRQVPLLPSYPGENTIPELVTPEDSASFRAMKERLDKIRLRRPTVAVVLSGGGAKGAAHIGALEYLESIGMPVDMILGTSMGGLVGGIYAMGYNASQLDSIIRKIDWTMVMSDNVPREYISYNESKYKEKYVLSIPFFYAKDYYRKLLKDEMQYVDAKRYQEKLDIGASPDGVNKLIKDNILGSLPSGYYYGQNVNNLINGLSVGYQDKISFTDLPIPFYCVATELVTEKAKYWSNGYLTTAMRSTMSVPGIFAPVKVDGMVLVDGGMRDNYPTALARALGADIVIGVEVSTDRRQYTEINNLGDIINQGIDMLGRSVYERNMTLTDINIHPDLPEYNMMSFDQESIDTIIHRGYAAAAQVKDQLLAIKEKVGADTLMLNNRKAIDINVQPVRISGIDIHGVTEKEKAILLRKIKVNPGDVVSKDDVEHIVAEIYGTQSYDYVTYEMEGTQEPFNLVINCKPGPIHQFGLGLRLDTEELVSVLLNIGINSHKLQGSRVDITGKISVNPSLKVHYSYDAPKMPTLNAMASIKWTDLNLLDFISGRFKLSYLDVKQEIFFSNMKWSMFDLQAGLRNEYFNVRSFLSADQVLGDYDLSQLRNDYLSLFLNARSDTFDDGFFPSKGYSTALSYGWTFAGFPNRFKNFHSVQFGFKGVVPAGKVFAFIPSVNFRFLFGDSVPLSYINLIGGSYPGRYVEQQIPFIGVNNVSSMRNILTVFRTDFRFQVARNHYLTAIVNYARDCNDFRTYGKGLGYFGAGAEYAFDTAFGPLSVDVHWSNLTKKVGFYINLGYYF